MYIFVLEVYKISKNTYLFLFILLIYMARRASLLEQTLSTHTPSNKVPDKVIKFTVPKCDRINEYFSCGSLCQNTCKHLREPCLIESILCKDDCYCLPGYARDDRVSGNNLTCIPEWQCDHPKGKCLGENEVFNEKGSPCQTTCARLGLPCPVFNKSHVSDCFCKTGYARDSNGICIPQGDCYPGRCGDIHEVYKSVNCPEYCKNLRGCNSKNMYRHPETRCYCQIGYVRRLEDDKCVPERACYD